MWRLLPRAVVTVMTLGGFWGLYIQGTKSDVLVKPKAEAGA